MSSLKRIGASLSRTTGWQAIPLNTDPTKDLTPLARQWPRVALKVHGSTDFCQRMRNRLRKHFLLVFPYAKDALRCKNSKTPHWPDVHVR
jgi:hypothetical protein